jgi:hypothetical protein
VRLRNPHKANLQTLGNIGGTFRLRKKTNRLTKNILILLFVLGLTTIFAQTEKIKIKKELPTQDKMTSVVTLAGYYSGQCSKANIFLDKHLKISNNTSGLKIISFYACLTTKGALKCYLHHTDSLGNDLMTEILMLKFPEGQKLYIDKIKAVNSKKDTLVLNPIILSLTK